METRVVIFLVVLCLQGTQVSSESELRIFFGTPTTKSYPWLASLKIHTGCNTWRKCAGTLIAQKWVLTAAHCVKSCTATPNKRQDYIYVYFGAPRLYYGWSTKSSKIIIHGLYQQEEPESQSNTSNHSTDFDYDIALIKLSKPLPKHLLSPIRLIGRLNSSLLEGQSAMVLGWGRNEKSKKSTQLRRGSVNLVSPDKCWAFMATNPDNKLCANIITENGTTICLGDSGGPLLVPIGNGSQTELVQIGIASYVASTTKRICGIVNVFTDLTQYIGWIEEITKENIL